VSPTPQLLDDLSALETLLLPETPPRRLLRSSRCLAAVYGFVDASEAGFGCTLMLPGNVIKLRHGAWGSYYDSVSSHFRELSNLVQSIEAAANEGELDSSELFIFTDNTTAEGAYYKGNSPNKHLFELVLRLRVLEMHRSLRLHVCHVAGSRMMAQSTDGLPRGVLMEGVLRGGRPQPTSCPYTRMVVHAVLGF
jgi:hypothetical protein